MKETQKQVCDKCDTEVVYRWGFFFPGQKQPWVIDCPNEKCEQHKATLFVSKFITPPTQG